MVESRLFTWSARSLTISLPRRCSMAADPFRLALFAPVICAEMPGNMVSVTFFSVFFAVTDILTFPQLELAKPVPD